MSRRKIEERGDINKLNIMRKEMQRQKEEMERQKEAARKQEEMQREQEAARKQEAMQREQEAARKQEAATARQRRKQEAMQREQEAATARQRRKQEEMQRQKEERERIEILQKGVTVAIGQDEGPLDSIARRGIQEFVPRPSFQDYVNSVDVQNVQPFVPPRILEARRQDYILQNSLRDYDMSMFQGGQRKKKKYKQTRTRQKKQHRRRRRRHSTRKHKK